MKSLVTALSAATLATSVAAQASPLATAPATALEPAKDIIPIIPSDTMKKIEGEWKYDACHKIDTSVAGGFIWPCASQLKIRHESCPWSAETAEERKAQRDCICGKGSSFLQDAVACSECKIQNGLQPEDQRKFWKDYFGALDKGYCQSDDVAVDFAEFTKGLPSPQTGVIAGNPLDAKIGNPRDYYTLAKVAVPEKQGPGKFTPAAPQPGVNDNTVNANISDPVAGQVVVPAFVAVEVNNEPSGANTAPVTLTPSAAGSQPTTLMRVTSGDSTAAATASLSPSSSLVPASGSNGGADVAHIILINGKLCHVYIIWVIIDCAPKKDAQGNLYIDYKNTGIDNTKPVSMLEKKEQFDKIKDTVHDASKDKNTAKQVKDIVGTEANVVAAPENNKPLPPSKTPAAVESQAPNGAAGSGTSDEPVTGTTDNTTDVSDDEDECVNEDVSNGANTPDNGSTNVSNIQHTQNPPSGANTPDNGSTKVPNTQHTQNPPSSANTPDNGSTNNANTENVPSSSTRTGAPNNKPAADDNTSAVSNNKDECVDEGLPNGANTPDNGSTNTHNPENVPSGGAGTGAPNNKPAPDNTPAMSDDEDEYVNEDVSNGANTPDNGSTNVSNTQHTQNHSGGAETVVSSPEDTMKNPDTPQGPKKTPSTQNPPSGGAETVVSGPEDTMKAPNTSQGSEKPPSTQNAPSGGADTVAPGSHGTKTTPNAPAQNSASTPGGQTGSDTPSNSGSQSETKDCECPSGSKAPERKDATEVCAKKAKTETDCNKESGENMRQCFCSEGRFQNQKFFHEAVICSRRSDNCLLGEYEAQVFFQTEHLYCDLKLFGNDYAAAYKNVSDSWRDGRAPTAALM
ncbi:herpesvirus latent membrane protein-like [Metarhizium robertsii]|uniref:Herpesvirus latent membrane protein-like n=1 Tax=Metarhizium robertsii TaxID=568076 RepID=A0A0A1UQK3_9HYPO|nr:herpesvirus latent membrane protein-like [Metarhizium robertsii]